MLYFPEGDTCARSLTGEQALIARSRTAVIGRRGFIGRTFRLTLNPKARLRIVVVQPVVRRLRVFPHISERTYSFVRLRPCCRRMPATEECVQLRDCLTGLEESVRC